MMMHGSTPEKFGAWMKRAIAFARENPVEGDAFVAVNAWNEWAEGAYLEPDTHFGAAYLNALSRAVHGVPLLAKSTPPKVVIVGHDANRHGAQILVANLARVMSQQFGLEVVILLCAPGPMVAEYEGLCETHVLPGDPAQNSALIAALAQRGFTRAIVNTTVSGLVTPQLKERAFHVSNLIHELGRLLHEYSLLDQAQAIAAHSDRIVFPAPVVRDSFPAPLDQAKGSVEVQAQGLYKSALLNTPRDESGIRAELGLPLDAKIVLNVSYADLRKGFDQFVAAAEALCETRDDVHFVWLGGIGQDIELWFMPGVKAGKHADHFHFVGHVEDVERWYAAADVFFLSAREDPFPSVVLEAIAVGLPAVGYAQTGGCDALIEQHGMLVSRADNAAAARAIDTLLKQSKKARNAAALAGKTEIAQHYLFDTYAHGLLAPSQGAPLARVSVIVPNYNYAACLEERLLSIFNQSYPVFEVIVLDDASSDESVAVIERTAAQQNRQIDLVVNKDNSGSPFKQWRKGLARARGDFIWIAEADDVADPDFLSKLMDAVQAQGADLGFSDSWQIDQNGATLGESYIPYANAIRGSGFDESFIMNGKAFLEQFLAVKNIILNVSCAVFRKEALEAAIERIGTDLDDMRVAGDWRIYAEICASDANIAYEARALNGHRRHASSVTHALNTERHLAEIAGMQAFVNGIVTVDQDAIAAQEKHLSDARSVLENDWNQNGDT
jgi:glycosyltransferase involved in cell wall biosynthesis